MASTNAKAALFGVLSVVATLVWLAFAALVIIIVITGLATGPGSGTEALWIALASILATGLVPAGLFFLAIVYGISPDQARRR